MKLYYHSKTLRMVGKVSEIRIRLKELSRLGLTVSELLQQKGH